MNTSMKAMKALNSSISLNECGGLNVEGTDSVKDIFGSGGTVKSNEGDPELIISVKFKEKVSIGYIMIESSMDTSKAPEILKLFANQENIDFSEVESATPTESFKIDSSNLGKAISLKVAKFRSLSVLTIYVARPSGDSVQLNNIQFYGSECETNINFNELKNSSP